MDVMTEENTSLVNPEWLSSLSGDTTQYTVVFSLLRSRGSKPFSVTNRETSGDPKKLRCLWTVESTLASSVPNCWDIVPPMVESSPPCRGDCRRELTIFAISSLFPRHRLTDTRFFSSGGMQQMIHAVAPEIQFSALSFQCGSCSFP